MRPMIAGFLFLCLVALPALSRAEDFVLRLDSDPAGASVDINGNSKSQRTPAEFFYAPGEALTITVSKGLYKEWNKTIVMPSNDVSLIAELTQDSLITAPIELQCITSKEEAKQFTYTDKSGAEHAILVTVKTYNPGTIRIFSMLHAEGWGDWKTYDSEKTSLENKAMDVSLEVDGAKVTRSVFAKEMKNKIDLSSGPVALKFSFFYQMFNTDGDLGLEAAMRRSRTHAETRVYQYGTGSPTVVFHSLQITAAD